MIALFHDVSVVHDENQVGVADCGQPVGDDKAGAVLHQLIHGLLDVQFGLGVDGTGRLVENQNLRVSKNLSLIHI